MHSASFPLSTGRHRTGYSPNVKRTYTLWSAVQVTAQKPWHPSHIKNTHKHRPIGVAEDHTSHITQSAGVDRRLLPSRYSLFLFYLIASTCRVVRERARHRSRYLLGTRRFAPGLWTKLSAIEPSSPFFFFLLLGPVTFTLRRSSLPLSSFARQTKPSVPCLRPLPYTFLLKSNS